MCFFESFFFSKKIGRSFFLRKNCFDFFCGRVCFLICWLIYLLEEAIFWCICWDVFSFLEVFFRFLLFFEFLGRG